MLVAFKESELNDFVTTLVFATELSFDWQATIENKKIAKGAIFLIPKHKNIHSLKTHSLIQLRIFRKISNMRITLP